MEHQGKLEDTETVRQRLVISQKETRPKDREAPPAGYEAFGMDKRFFYY